MTSSERWTPKPLTELAAGGAEVPWVWEGYLAKGSVTLLVGLWKAGKTTLLSWLAKALTSDADTFAGSPIRPGRVLFVTEESEAIWCGRRDDLKLGERIEIISRPFLGRPDMPTWYDFVHHTAALAMKRPFDLVVFDTFPNLSPIQDENDNAGTITALTPLHVIAEAGAAVLLTGHPRKGDAAEGKAMRGAGATPGFVDIIVELRRYDAQHRDNRRTLSGFSRYEATPSELILSFDPKHGYRAAGTKAEITTQDRIEVVREILCGEAALTVEELRRLWPDGEVPKPGSRTLKEDLDQAVEEEPTWLVRVGEGVRGDPHRYVLADSIPASIECVEASAAENSAEAA